MAPDTSRFLGVAAEAAGAAGRGRGAAVRHGARDGVAGRREGRARQPAAGHVAHAARPREIAGKVLTICYFSSKFRLLNYVYLIYVPYSTAC